MFMSKMRHFLTLRKFNLISSKMCKNAYFSINFFKAWLVLLHYDCIKYPMSYNKCNKWYKAAVLKLWVATRKWVARASQVGREDALEENIFQFLGDFLCKSQFIMHEIYYKIRNMKSPINKWLLDQTNGVIIDANTEEIDSLNIVTSVR